MRSRRAKKLTAALSIAALTTVLAGAAGAAWATPPVTLGAGRVLDQSEVLSAGEEQTVQARSEALSASSGVDLWVVYVDHFTDPEDRVEWAADVAEDNGLGTHQYLLAIATDGHQFYLSGDSNGPVSGDQLDAIERQRIQPALSDGDWAGAAVAAADGLEDAVGGGTGGPPADAAAGGGFFGGLLIFLILAAIAAVVIWLVVRARRTKTREAGREAPTQDELSGLSTAELGRRASSALVQTDDAVKTSEQELGFAKAQFGDAAAAEFEKVLAQAKTDLEQAFSLKQQLDDGTKDTEEQTRAWNAQILQLCAHANQELDAKAADFDELRKLEQNAPEALARVQELRGTVGAAYDAAVARLATLGRTYAPEALASVADNPAQAAQRLSFADQQLTAAQTAIGSGDGAVAAVSIRAAEEAVSQANLLEEAIGKRGDELAQGEKDAAALIADLERDIAGASAVADPDGRIGAVVASTRQVVDAARANLASSAKRPLYTLEALENANTQIDTLMEGVRAAQEKERRAAQLLNQLLTQAQAQVSAAEDFITSRRGAIGADARTRLAEAGSSLVQARQLATTDAPQALQYAQRANDMAAQAIQLAQNDVGAFDGGGMFGGGGGNRGGGGDLMGAVLGGIVINSLLGGGGRGGGNRGGGMFGGGGMGGGRPSGGRPSGGGLSPGSFGGGGTRSRRGGGRF